MSTRCSVTVEIELSLVRVRLIEKLLFQDREKRRLGNESKKLVRSIERLVRYHSLFPL